MPTVIVTRPVSKQQAALECFSGAGFNVFSAPCYNAITNKSIKAGWLGQASQAEVLVVLNSHAIDAILEIQDGFQVNAQTKVLAIGGAVAEKWQQHFEHPVTDVGGNSEAMVDLLSQIKPKDIAVLTAAGGRELIKSYALKRGINYSQVNCYVRQGMSLEISAWQKLLDSESNCILTANSGKLLNHIKSQLPNEMWLKLKQQPLVTGAKRITEVAEKLGFADVITARSPSNQDMLSALIES